MALIKSISGIRGTIGGRPGEGLTPLDVVKFTAAFGQWLLLRQPDPKGPHTVVIGRDGRISGAMVSQLVAATLQGMGLHVLDLGLSTTPTVEMAVPGENAIGGIILTASHNPIQWNALKLLNETGEFISAEDGNQLLELADNEAFTFADVKKLGTYRADAPAENTWLHKHIAAILALPLVDREAIAKRNFRIVVDGVNSTGGLAVPLLLEALGVETITRLHCEPTGYFAHNPEPLPENLTDIINLTKRDNQDLGIVGPRRNGIQALG